LIGAVLGILLFFVIGASFFFTKEKDGSYNIDPMERPGGFEPILARYLRLAEFIIGLATGSVVLLIGSSALHGQAGHLPWFYTSPLLLLGWCVIFGIGFMACLMYNYESYQHGEPHTRFKYSLAETLGFSSLACFCFGYVGLIVGVTR